MIYVVLFAVAVVTVGGPLRRVLKRIPSRPTADPELLALLAGQHPMRVRPRAVDALGPWTVEDLDGPEFQALLAEVLAVTHAPSGSQ